MVISMAGMRYLVGVESAELLRPVVWIVKPVTVGSSFISAIDVPGELAAGSADLRFITDNSAMRYRYGVDGMRDVGGRIV